MPILTTYDDDIAEQEEIVPIPLIGLAAALGVAIHVLYKPGARAVCCAHDREKAAFVLFYNLAAPDVEQQASRVLATLLEVPTIPLSAILNTRCVKVDLSMEPVDMTTWLGALTYAPN